MKRAVIGSTPTGNPNKYVIMTSQADNRRIAKNTMLLYFRMIITLGISLYTSRLVLATLGITDYGIYNAVGGFVAMFQMINGAMSTATQRFLSFEIGKGNIEKIKKIFSTAVLIHIILAAIIILVAETIGLWFLNNKMVFPVDRYIAANWVFQFSILTFVVNVISVPYNAALIAYERMSAFAYVSIIEVVLKLAIVYLLLITPNDALIVYSLLTALVAVSIRLIYGIYVKKNLENCKCIWKFDTEIRNEMMSFVSWNLIGSIAGIVEQQGITVLLNLFFGATVNAARGVANQVLNAVNGFVSNYNLAMNPQIIKLYANGERDNMFKLVFMGSKSSFMMMLLLSAPIYVEAPYILRVWLVEVPDFTVIFLRLVILITLVDAMKHTMVASVHASGKVKKYQLTNGIVSLTTIPIAYILLKMGNEPQIAMFVSLFIAIICHFIRIAVLHHTICFPVTEYLKNVTLRMFIIAIICIITPFYVKQLFSETFLSCILVICVSVLLTLVTSLYIGFDSTERSILLNKIIKIISNKIK